MFSVVAVSLPGSNCESTKSDRNTDSDSGNQGRQVHVYLHVATTTHTHTVDNEDPFNNQGSDDGMFFQWRRSYCLPLGMSKGTIFLIQGTRLG